MWKKLVIIQIYLLISVAKGQSKCPPPSEISPCVCITTFAAYLSCVTSMDNIYRVLDQASAQRLEFYSISLDFVTTNSSKTTEKLRPDLLGNATTVRLNIYFENSTEPLNPFVFRGQENNLKSIAFRRFKLSDVPVNALTDLKLIELHYVMDGSLTKLKKGCFETLKHPKEMAELYLYGNRIDTIEDNVFDPFENLRTLFLDNNTLTVISAKPFPNILSGLKMLSFKKNVITTFPLEIIKRMSKRCLLYLADNKIKEISKDVMDVILDKKLNLDLRGNPIRCGCSFLVFPNQYQESGAQMYPYDTFCSTPPHLHGVKLSDLNHKRLANCTF